MKHQIPASVMKIYLDAIIQNSTALKSSLLRGAVDEIDPNGIPFVFPLQSGVPAVAAPVQGLLRPTRSSEPTEVDEGVLNAKNAEISALKSQLDEKEGIIKELELKTMEALANYREAQDKLSRQGGEVAAAPSASAANANDSELGKQLEEVTKERDLLKEKLKEYEIIEHDLAEIPRMQREIDQLKKSLAAYEQSGSSTVSTAPAAAVATAVGTETPANTEQSMILNASDDDVDMEKAMKEMEAMAAPVEKESQQPPATEEKLAEVTPLPTAEASDKPAEENKSAKVDDELLSQFEKMLS